MSDLRNKESFFYEDLRKTLAGSDGNGLDHVEAMPRDAQTGLIQVCLAMWIKGIKRAVECEDNKGARLRLLANLVEETAALHKEQEKHHHE